MTAGSYDKGARRLRLLFLASNPRLALQKNYAPGERPNPFDFWQMLSEQGIDVDIIDPTPWPLNPFAGRHPFFQSLDPYRSLKVLLCRRNYDLLVSGGEGSAIILVLLRRLFRFKTPIIVWDISPATRWRLRKRLQDYVLPRVDAILALNSRQVPYIAERWGASISVAVSGYMVDTNFYRPSDEKPQEYILSVGDDPGRDYPTLLDAMDGISTELVIKTKLPLPLNPQKHKSVRLVSDHLDHLAFRRLYDRCRFVVLPLKSDTLNASGVTTLVEAYAMGKAVIVTSSDGVRDFLSPEETCVEVPAYNADALRAAIQRLLREPETCERLGKNARRFAEEHCSKPIQAHRLAAMWRRYVKQETA